MPRPGKGAGAPSPGQDQAVVLLGALCFFLSTLEYMIPKPLPFLRLGLANLPLILAVDLLPLRPFATLALIKVLGQGLITGTLFSYVFLFSLGGTFASAAVMYLLRRSLGPERISFIGISVAGALASNALQLVLARRFILGEGTALIAPPFLMAGLFTGVALGLFSGVFASRSRWYRDAAAAEGQDAVPAPGQDAPGQHTAPAEKRAPAEAPPPSGPGLRSRAFSRFPPGDLFAAGLLMMAAFLLTPSTLGRFVQAALFWLYGRLLGKRGRPLLTVGMVLGIVFFNLLFPYGRVLAEVGPLRITQGSLLGGLHKALTLEGLIFLSQAAIRPGLRLPGRIGRFLGASFQTFEALKPHKGLITRKGFIEGIDRLMVELENGAGESGLGAEGGPRRTLGGSLILAGAVLLAILAGLMVGVG